MDCRSFLSEEELAPATQQKFWHDVRQFYVACVRKMLNKFPFGSETLQQLQVLDHSLGADTLTAFLQVKINSEACCHDFKVTGSMIDKAKICTDEYNKEHK
ncbi:hypothetical protein V1264_005801 [Littorina saxatilis]|uniref:Uncharacterized protein n=1 Tax=Littorina saxatilis TaxID=31220 RepID=A0AAN9G7D1_9CAEN